MEVTAAQMRHIHALGHDLKLSHDDLRVWASDRFAIASMTGLDVEQAGEMIEHLRREAGVDPPPAAPVYVKMPAASPRRPVSALGGFRFPGNAAALPSSPTCKESLQVAPPTADGPGPGDIPSDAHDPETGEIYPDRSMEVAPVAATTRSTVQRPARTPESIRGSNPPTQATAPILLPANETRPPVVWRQAVCDPRAIRPGRVFPMPDQLN